MKSIVPMIMMVVLAISGGCGSSVEKEAVKRAKECWNLTQIGGSTYLCEITVETHPSGYFAVGTRASKTVFELRNSKVEVSPVSLTEADRLNGVEWGGRVHLAAGAFRRYSPQPYYGGEPDKTWSDWKSPAQLDKGGVMLREMRYADNLSVRKIKGEWEVVRSFATGELLDTHPPDITFKQVEASDLPK